MLNFPRIPFVSLLILCASCAASGAGNNDQAWWKSSVPAEAPEKAVVRRSLYVEMSDKVKLAVSTYLPEKLSEDDKLPTILIQTRYFRAISGRWPFRDSVEKPAAIIQRLVDHGYAVVEADVRGTGASFGSNPHPWTRREIDDGYELVDWIIRQPWANYNVGATGISYDGTSAEFLLSTAHPAVKAVAPRFSLFDAYTDIAFPGGVFHRWFVKNWAEGNQALDSNTFQSLLGFFGSLAVHGVMPVDDDVDEEQLKAAVKEHQANLNIYEEAKTIVFRDDPAASGFSVDEISPFSVRNDLTKTNKPILSMSGWFDGAYAHAAIKRFQSIPNFGSRLIIGPWDHGGRQNISPSRKSVVSGYDQIGELIRFFDEHLKHSPPTQPDQDDIHYYTMVEERWKSSSSWPPEEAETATYYLARGHRLWPSRPNEKLVSDSYEVDYSAGTGPGARWRSLYNLEHDSIGYPDRKQADKKLAVYDTAVLPVDVEVTGHPIVTLYLTSTSTDGDVFAYLEEINEDGDVNYITEGQLRLLNRELSDEDPPYKSPAPYRSYLRTDAKLMVPGEITEVQFDLQPISYLVKKGHRIRLAISGADIDYFAPSGGKKKTTLNFYRGGGFESRLSLPVIPRSK